MNTIDKQIAVAAAVAAEKAKLNNLRKDVRDNVESYTTENKLGVTIMLRQDFTKDKPRNTEQLFQSVEALFGIRIPFKAATPGMQTPMEWLDAMFFGKEEATLAMAHRGGAKTYTSAIGQMIMMMYNPGWESINAGATKTQANVTQKYLRNFARDPILGAYLQKGQVNKGDAHFQNGSYWQIVTGSMSGVCLSRDTHVQTENGNIPIARIVGAKTPIRVKSYNFDTGEIEYRKVTNFYNHGIGGEFYYVKTAYQDKPKGPGFTKNHEVFLYDGTTKQVGELVEGDLLAFEGYRFSEAQKQVILGGLLGDATCQKDGRYSFAHGLKQEYYGDWKAKAIGGVGLTKSDCKGGFGTLCKLWRSVRHPYFKQLRSETYNGRTKFITLGLLNQLDKLGIAVWFMDDGCFSKSGAAINSQGFTLEENQLIVEWFCSKGFECKVRIDSGAKPYVAFNSKGAVAIREYIKNYVQLINGVKTWVATELEIEQGAMGVIPVAFEELVPHKVNFAKNKYARTRYDIEVEGLHNFILNNGQVVHNSGQHPSSLFLDEIEFWDKEAIEQTWAVPQAKNGYFRVWAAFSTRQRCLPYYTRVITEDGPMKIGKIVNSKYSGKVRVWDADKKEWAWRKVVQWHRNGSSTEWYKVYTKHSGLGKGGELVATGDHYVYYDVDKKKKLRDFTVEDSLVMPSWVPSAQQKQVIYGKLLGDGHIHRGSLRVEHSHKQKYYVEWFVDVMREVCSESLSHNKSRNHYLARTVATPYMHNVGAEWYSTGSRRIPDYVWDELDDFGLAVWLMDDGSYRKVSTDVWHIYCQNFNQHERDKAEEWFSARGIKITWQTKGTQFYGYIGGDSAREVTRRVAKYIDVSQHLGKRLGYKKWIASSDIEHGTHSAVKVPIARIEVEKTKPIGCYDIGVDEIHNYTNGSGVLVSNSYGGMNWLVDNSSAKGLKLYTWTVFESMERCPSCEAIDAHPNGTDEARQSVCALYEDCHGVLGTKSLGWMKKKDVITLKRNMSKDSWNTQGLCRKPSSAGLVVHNFIHEHKLQGGNYTTVTYNPELPYYVVHDPAEGKKSVLYVIQVAHGESYVVWESVIPQCKNDAQAKKAFIDDFMVPIANSKKPLCVVVDPRRPDSIATWRSVDVCGVAFTAARPTLHGNTTYSDTQIGTTINLLRTEVEENGRRKLFVNPHECPNCVNGLKEYHYPSDINGEVTSDTPDKAFSDEIDPLRYWVMYKKTALDKVGGFIITNS